MPLTRKLAAEFILKVLDGHLSANSTVRALTSVPATMSSPTEMGSLNRRGPQLPGLTYKMPSRLSTRGLCEWPDTITCTPAACGSMSSCERSWMT